MEIFVAGTYTQMYELAVKLSIFTCMNYHTYFLLSIKMPKLALGQQAGK